MHSVNRLLFCAALLLVIVGLSAQTYSWPWATRAGSYDQDTGYAVATDSQGNIYATGYFMYDASFGSTTLTGGGAFVAKLDPGGNWLWAVQSTGSGLCCGYGIDVDELGYIYVSGYFENTVGFGSTTLTSSGGQDIFAAKLDTGGNFLWAVKAGGTGNERGMALAVDNQSNVYMTGYFADTVYFEGGSVVSAGVNDIFVAKLDAGGDFLWVKRAGGLDQEIGFGIAADSQANVYLTGFFTGTVSFGAFSLVSSGNSDMFAAKLDSAGNWLWAVKSAGPSSEKGNAIAVDAGGSVWLTGEFYNTVMFGSTQLVSSGYQDVFIAKLDTNGNWLWARRGGGEWADIGEGIAVDTDGNCYATGYFQHDVTFGPYLVNNLGADDVFITRLDAEGEFLCGFGAGGGGYDFSYAIALDESANAFLTGYFEGTSQFGYTSLTSVYNGVQNEYSRDVFVAKFSSAVPVDDDIAPGASGHSSLSDIYPNPFRRGETATIKASISDIGGGSLSVFNLRGQCVARHVLTAGEQQISLDSRDLATGIYLCRLRTTSACETRKLVLLR